MSAYIAKVNFDAGDGVVKAGQSYSGGDVERLLKEGLIVASKGDFDSAGVPPVTGEQVDGQAPKKRGRKPKADKE